jgi:hypothetical protein
LTNLIDFLTDIRLILGDPDAVRYADDTLRHSLRWALDAYSRCLPQIITAGFSVQAAGREQSLAALPGLLNVMEVFWPCQPGQENPPAVRQWYFYQREGENFFYISGARMPNSGDVIWLTYAARHTISGLDAAAFTSLPDMHNAIVQSGAAGKAAGMRAFSLIESYGRKSDEADTLKVWSESLLADFSSDLLALKNRLSLRGALDNGWRLDRWDR